MATTVRLNQSATENPQYVAGGDFGAVIASTLTGANHIAAVVDGDLTVKGTITGATTGNVTGNASTATTITGLVAKNYADDAAAATAGVPVGGIYHTSGAMKVRLA